MRRKDQFTSEGFRYNLSANSFVHRIFGKNGSLARLDMDQKLDADAMKFTDPSVKSRLSYASRNLEKKEKGIVTFNIPEERIAYKVVYEPSVWPPKPERVFMSTDEGKWKIVPEPSSEVLRQFEIERAKLVRFMYYDPSARELEGPVILR